jgi:hypothetical protein
MALRDMSDFMATHQDKISPIIEPVKFSSTLNISLKTFKEKNINFTLIINPECGDTINKTEDILSLVNSELDTYSNFQI